MWDRGTSRITEADATRFRARRKELGLGPLVIHANYLINLASPNPVLRTRSILGFHSEIVRAVALGADYLVIHPGSAPRSLKLASFGCPALALAEVAAGSRRRGAALPRASSKPRAT